MNAKEIFKELYRRAREFHRIVPDTTAFWLNEMAVRDFFEEGHYDEGINRVLDISRSVLWALHWQRMKPCHELRPNSAQSEIRYNWSSASPVIEFPGPRLPA